MLLSPSQTITLDVDGATVRVVISGRGDPVLLVHGLAGSTAWWVRNVEVFSRNHSVYLIDLPGFGSMRKYARQFSVAGSAKWLANVLSALRLDQTTMVGHSMGGLIAAMFAAKYPNRVTKLVLAAPAIALLHKSVLPLLFPLIRETIYVRPAFFPTLVRDTARAGFFTMLRASRELLAVDIEQELRKITAPSLLMFGEHDPLVPASLGPKLQSQMPGSSLFVLPDAGHILMYDRADLFNETVVAFLAHRP
jgi:pimeloyl-ACP methyl ester carboxylesterase